MLSDLRYGLRQLAKAPGFTATAVLTLAVGIGATTAIFTLVYDVLLRPLPFDHPEQLVRMQEQVAEFKDLYPTLPMNANHFEMWQRNSKTIQAMTVMGEASVPLGAGGHPQQVKTVARHAGNLRGVRRKPAAWARVYRAGSVARTRPRGGADERSVADAVRLRCGDPGQDHPAEWV